MYRIAFFLMFSIMALSCTGQDARVTRGSGETGPVQATFVGLNGEALGPVNLPEEVWKQKLSPLAFKVLRQQGTERAFSGAYWNNKKEGIYTCGGCGLPLFSSDTKFKSGTGWPSFYEPIEAGHIVEHADNSYGMRRVEVVCARCGGHQGHVFNDGPKPTGLRYCINSVSLDFVEKEKE